MIRHRIDKILPDATKSIELKVDSPESFYQRIAEAKRRRGEEKK
jgi:hypothetical protein